MDKKTKNRLRNKYFFYLQEMEGEEKPFFNSRKWFQENYNDNIKILDFSFSHILLEAHCLLDRVDIENLYGTALKIEKAVKKDGGEFITKSFIFDFSPHESYKELSILYTIASLMQMALVLKNVSDGKDISSDHTLGLSFAFQNIIIGTSFKARHDVTENTHVCYSEKEAQDIINSSLKENKEFFIYSSDPEKSSEGVLKYQGSKGGKRRFENLYKVPKEYTLKEFKKLRKEDPQISRRKGSIIIAKKIKKGAVPNTMAPNNVQPKVYDWIRQKFKA